MLTTDNSRGRAKSRPPMHSLVPIYLCLSPTVLKIILILALAWYRTAWASCPVSALDANRMVERREMYGETGLLCKWLTMRLLCHPYDMNLYFLLAIAGVWGLLARISCIYAQRTMLPITVYDHHATWAPDTRIMCRPKIRRRR